MLSFTIQNYLERNQVPYEEISHPVAFDAQRTAASAHISGHKLCKTVIVKIDGQMTMLVLHADERVDLDWLRESLGVKEVKLASESEFESRFPDCEQGAEPPFGDLFNMPVIVSESVASSKKVVFNAGTHSDLISMDFDDFRRLTKPVVGSFAAH